MGVELNAANEHVMLMLGDEVNNARFLEHAYVKFVRCLWPRRCFITRKSLWFKSSVRVRRYCRLGDHTFGNQDRWFNAKEFTIMKLKGHA